MPTTLTLKNIPDDLHQQLREAARRHRRSLNSEAIACLESILAPQRISSSEQLNRIRKLRAGLAETFDPEEIDTLKGRDRP